MKNKKLLGILGITALLLAGNFAWREAKGVDAAATKTIYLNPNGKEGSNAWFWVHAWDNNNVAEDKEMSDSDGDGVYEVEISSSKTKIIFVRANPADKTVGGSWSSK